MSKITEYGAATDFDAGDVLLKDGTNGTKKITAENAAAALVSMAVDTTMSQAGKAADAAAAGAEFGEIKTGVTNLSQSNKSIVALTVETPTYSMIPYRVISNAGAIAKSTDERLTISGYIPVQPGWIVAYKHSCARWFNQNWVFYDENYAVVATSGKTESGKVEEFSATVCVPFGAAYFVLAVDIAGSTSARPNEDIRVVKEYAESIDTSPESANVAYDSGCVSTELFAVTTATGYVIGAASLVVATSSESYIVTQAAVSRGDVVQISNCSARYSNKMYAFFDASDLPIHAADRVDSLTHDFYVKVPFGAVKLVASGYGSAAEIKRVTGIRYASPLKWVEKKWAAIGDSLTEVNSRASKRYHDYIAERTGITVVNLGLGGTGYKKQYNDNLPFYQRIDTIPLDSDIITIFGSGNDCSQTLGDVTDTGTDTICGCINNTIDGIRARIVGANIGIIAPTPWQPYPTTTAGNKMDLYVGALQEICKRKGVPFLDLYHCSNMLPWEQGFREAFYTHDDGNGTHPDENGHKFFAPRIKAFLETLLM